MQPQQIPISEQINRFLFDVVSTVNVNNGFNYDLVCERQRVRNRTGHLCCVQIDMEPETILENSTFGMQEVDRVIAFEIYLLPSDDDDTPLAEYFANLHSDITRAVMVDPTLGGLALDTTPTETGLLADDDGQINGVLVSFTIRYRYLTSDPTKQ